MSDSHDERTLDLSLMPSEDDTEVLIGLILANFPSEVAKGDSIVIPLGDAAAVIRDLFLRLTYAGQSAKAIQADMDEYPGLGANEAIARHQVRITSSFN